MPEIVSVVISRGVGDVFGTSSKIRTEPRIGIDGLNR